jgi:outer membrane immunogenic protein
MQPWRSACAGLALVAMSSASEAADYDLMPSLAPAFGWSGIYLGANASLGLAKVSGADFQGILGGGYGGVNFLVTGPVVFGVEADANASDLSTTTSLSILGIPTAVRSRTYGTASLRGRVGFAVDRFMVYGTGGYGVAANTMSSTIAGVTATDAKLHYGFTYGGGVEFRVLPMLNVRGEFLRAHYDSKNYFVGIPSGAIENNVIRVGVSYIR